MLAFDHLIHAVGCTPKEAEKRMKELGFHTVHVVYNCSTKIKNERARRHLVF